MRVTLGQVDPNRATLMRLSWTVVQTKLVVLAALSLWGVVAAAVWLWGRSPMWSVFALSVLAVGIAALGFRWASRRSQRALPPTG